MELTIKLETAEYAIHVEPGLAGGLSGRLAALNPGRVAVVTDSTVWGLHGEAFGKHLQGLRATVTVLPPGEATKSHQSLLQLYREWMAAGLTRKDLVLAFGGGVIGDLTGFAAATYLRGVPFVQIPTTLLSQVDSSIGGKVAVNLPEGKNLVGTFYHPQAVWIDPEYLKTLPDRILKDGMAEVVKAGCIGDAGLYSLLRTHGIPGEPALLQEMITRALAVKQRLVEADEKETGLRKLLNFGHTIGHALESYGAYSRWTHGEAVALGMVWITACAEHDGLCRPGLAGELKLLLQAIGLPTEAGVSLEALAPWLGRDKKRTSSGIELALVREPGNSFLYEVAQENLQTFLSL